ncbi:bifunctional 4-hydroxy-2-oxoglutarate aldolase/2-dehydro-3-deoxy-phosphogluconate aldolase [Lysobacter brunescens]|uniref:2-dehydro-3-deoxy-phosphogluconate aldolase n=1 Tax=Lysobacter brunescens TaxID=262323 RepID=A0ABW2YFF6_9GAMM
MGARSAALDALFERTCIVPVLVVESLDDAEPLARALVDAGLPVLEVTLRTPVALQAIERMRRVPGAIVGAGTVLDARDLDAVARAGAAFAISPGATPALLRAGNGHVMPLLPGIATASDLMVARELGYRRFKFFPAESSGGVAALRSLAGPFGDVRFCPTGGIDAAKAPAYLALPNVFAVGGSWMVPANSVRMRDWAAIHALARNAAALRRA